MKRSIIAPGRYVQGRGVLSELPGFLDEIGASSPFVITGSHVGELYRGSLQKIFADAKVDIKLDVYGGECCDEEIERLADRVGECRCVIAFGGGKAIDTGKAVADRSNVPVIVVPTTVSTDAPCSRRSVIYTRDGVLKRIDIFRTNPAVVLVDLDIIVKAPARHLSAGIGDAMATYYETIEHERTSSPTPAGGVVSRTAMALARECRDVLLKSGEKALFAVRTGVCTEALENIVEANTYMSGLGFENGGLAAAHSIHDGLTVLPQARSLMHGEKVAFGVVCQMVYNDHPSEEIAQIVRFFRSVELPVCLDDLRLGDISDEDIMRVAEKASSSDERIHCHHQDVSPKIIYDIIKAASAYAKRIW